LKDSISKEGAAQLHLEQRVFSEDTEPEWAVGPLTRHRLVVFLLVCVLGAILYVIQIYVWPIRRAPVSTLEHVWVAGHFLWLAGVPLTTMMIAGIFMYRKAPLVDIPYAPHLVVWRIVTRGDNVSALTSTIHTIQKQMMQTPIFPFEIEVITESGALEQNVVPLFGDNVRFVHVPSGYQTLNGTKFKARALQYAVEHSTVPDDAWLVHLDEETAPDRSGLLGIAKMIGEEEVSGALRIGQGAILYHRQWRRHPIMTMADNSRTGMDFGPFYLQSQIGTSVFGFHGSYIVIRNDVEKATGGFDLGPAGSIAEDAWWILIANQKGYKIRWVEGFLVEQSTQDIWDFLQQRRRWMEGLIKVVRFAPVPLWRRLPVALNLAFWGVVCFSILYSFAHLFYGFDTHPGIRLAANWSLATCATMYVVGLLANLNGAGITNPFARLGLIVVQTALLPLFCLLEVTAGVLGLFFPKNAFHVIKK
jgi:egghead protein (zeste-white 4 protein)